MSRHFTYEIDENHLSVKLKNLQLPINEEAWQRFNGMADACFAEKTMPKGLQHIIKDFRIPLNRKTLKPLAFATSVIMFAILLFNFVSIKVSPKKFADGKQTKVSETVLTQEIKQKPLEPVLPAQHNVQQTPALVQQTNPTQPVKQSEMAETPQPSVDVQPRQTTDIKPAADQVAEQIRPEVITEDDENATVPLTPQN